MQRLPGVEYEKDNKENQLDHSTMHEFVALSGGEYRDLSATVSAQNEVIKDLIAKVERLQSVNGNLKLLVCQDHPDAEICNQ